MNNNPVKILAISGSLRANSSNNIIIKAVAAMAPAGVQFSIYNELALIPPFNDSRQTPPAVAGLRQIGEPFDLGLDLFFRNDDRFP